jgi:YD repeat-containing protein
MFQGAKDAYYLMRDHPGIAYRCGTFALKSVGEELQPTNHALEGLVGLPSPANGFSMATLMDLSKKCGLNLVAVRRTAGEDLVVPSVVHWRQNHYAAILQKQDDAYLVSDPTFGKEKWMTADAINEEASGEFLVPAKSEPEGWAKLARNDMEKIHGMGLKSNINDKKDCVCVRNFSGEMVCTCPHTKGMPVWWVSEPYINLWIQDEPISYLTSRGKPFSFQITYKQRDGGWSNSWASSITMEGLTPCGGIGCGSSFYNSDITVDLPNGGEVEFPTKTGSAFNYDPPRYDSETRLMIQPVLTNYVSQSFYDDGTYGLRLVHEDGSQDIYEVGEVSGLAGEPPEGSGNLVRRIDADGDTTSFQYDVANRLVSVIDPDGRTNALIYSGNRLSEVINPYGLTAQFKYDSSGNLTNITDAQGISSSITYDTNNYPTSLITPYGTTHFNLTDNGISYGFGNAGGDDNGLIDRSALVVDPTGATNLYMYRYDTEMVMPSNSFTTGVPTNSPLGTLDTGTGPNAGTNSAVWFRNSFYWGPMQYAHLSTVNMTNFTRNDYLLGRMQHWLQDTNELDVTGYLSAERDPSPDGVNPGLLTFYDYQGKTFTDQEGTSVLPSVRAYQLPDGSTHYDYLLFDYFDNITNWISTYSLPSGGVGTRTNQFIYANNTYAYSWGQSFGSGINYIYTTYYTVPNLLTQVIGADGKTIWSYGGFDTVTWTNLFYIDPGQPGGGSYATNGTITVSSRVLPNYATNGLGQITTVSYTGGRPVSFNNTNEDTLIADYAGWNKVAITTSAAGLTTTNIYNANGFLVQTIDQQIGRTNSFGYTANGLIGSWTNELGMALGLTWDNLLRLVQANFPDGTYDYVYYNPHFYPLDPYSFTDRMGNSTGYVYDGDRHLSTVTDANNHTTTYDWCGCGALTAVIDALSHRTALNYDNQGNVTNVLYPDNTSLTYAYDSAERLRTISDGLGRSLSLAYNNQGLITTVSNANGLLESVVYDVRDRPFQITDANGVTVTNAYDVMDELLSRTWSDGIGESFGYNAAGLIAYTNRDSKVTQYGLDAARRLVAVTNANKEVIRVAYDPSGEAVVLTNGLNQTTKWQYNVYGWAYLHSVARRPPLQQISPLMARRPKPMVISLSPPQTFRCSTVTIILPALPRTNTA